MTALDQSQIRDTVTTVLSETKIVDIHTHVYDPALGDILLWGIDELLTYHYLVAEVFRARPEMEYDDFWAMSKSGQADLIWQELFVKRSPISEACRGVLTVLKKLGLDSNVKDLTEIRQFFAEQDIREYIGKVLDLAGIEKVYMTNDPLDSNEGPGWEAGFERDMRFLGVLRLDSALMDWPAPVEKLREKGYEVEEDISEKTISEIRRYLNDWCGRLDAHYMAISLPPTFTYPDESSTLSTLMAKCVFPTAEERGIPSAMMIGVKKRVNAPLGDAGDSLGKMNISTIENIASDFPKVKFLVTLLSRENQHELAIVARKFGNVVPFGCWWFLNNPSIIRDMTSMRLETLGLSFVPQHSDARVLDQLIYKWSHSREVIGDVLIEKYSDLVRTGWNVTEEAIRRDVGILFDAKIIK